ncbi:MULTISPECIES: RDD family protein [unclassified Streptomyces]|uniref:RDD family protein n=1 Tax=unclassified Streptomyces TaxID=2593676 RepID=UPI0038007245
MAQSKDAAPAIEGRRFFALIIDGALGALSGIIGAPILMALMTRGEESVQVTSPLFWVVGISAALCFSFLNHVALTALTRASVGKFLTGLRVVTPIGHRRPTPGEALGRWVFGLFWMVVYVPIHVLTDSSLDQQDAVGLQIMRRRDVSSSAG